MFSNEKLPLRKFPRKRNLLENFLLALIKLPLVKIFFSENFTQMEKYLSENFPAKKIP